jgi:hypothetical protein
MIPQVVLQMVLVLCDKWASWAVEHLFLLDVTSRMIPELHLRYSYKVTLLAPEGFHLSLRVYTWHSNARLLLLTFNHILSSSWGYHMMLTEVCLQFCYVFGDKITLTAFLVRTVSFVVSIEVSPSERRTEY